MANIVRGQSAIISVIWKYIRTGKRNITTSMLTSSFNKYDSIGSLNLNIVVQGRSETPSNQAFEGVKLLQQ